MENKSAAILVLAIVAALVITTGAAYAVAVGQRTSTRGAFQGTVYRSGMGPSMMDGGASYAGGMMGGYPGFAGGMMGGYSMMGYGNGTGSMYEYMEHHWNSTSAS